MSTKEIIWQKQNATLIVALSLMIKSNHARTHKIPEGAQSAVTRDGLTKYSILTMGYYATIKLQKTR